MFTVANTGVHLIVSNISHIRTKEKDCRDESSGIMRISNHTYATQNLLRYCPIFLSSISRKTLNPNIPHSVVPSISHRTVSSLCNSSSGSSSFFYSGSYSVFCFGLYAIQKKQFYSSGSALKCYSNPYLPIKGHFSIKSSSWLSSRCKIESYSGYEHQSLCYFSSGRPKIGLKHSVLQSLSSLTLSKHDSYYVCSNSGCFRCGNVHRCFSVSSSNGTNISGPVVESEVHNVANVCFDQQKLEKRSNYPPNFVLETVDIIRNNGEDLESRLNLLSSRLSVYSITEIFEVLNTQRISGLRFFEWILSKNPRFRRNANVCSLIIDNLGRLHDYETMFALLQTFMSEKICLTYEAFRFLPISASTNSSLNESTQRVVDLLNKVGGSCRNSGVCALIEMFCKLDLFDMARYVIKITERRKSYYCLLIREKCKNCLIEDAYGIIREMQETHCAPNTTVYNYLLGSLWKNGKMDEAFALLNEMKEFSIPPDAITFEILINFVCSLGKMDDAHKLLDQMVSQGLEPRLTTHARIVKTLFAAEKYEAAHKHVVDSSYKTSSSMIYSLMANLYWEKGDIVSARDALVEMMEKCRKPNFSVYVKIVKQLRRTGRGNLARDLESRHSKFVIKSRA